MLTMGRLFKRNRTNKRTSPLARNAMVDVRLVVIFRAPFLGDNQLHDVGRSHEKRKRSHEKESVDGHRWK